MDSDSPLVSVVTPAYNEAEFIEDNLRSVAAQDYGNLEHIVIDDGSEDHTTEILEEYEDDYPLRWWTKENEGQAKAMNEGFGAADGEIIVWLNGDDILVTRSAISVIASYFNENPRIDVAYARRATINEDTIITNLRIPISRFTSARLKRWCFGAFIYFRSHVIESEQLDPSLNYALDYEYFLRLDDAGYEFGYIPEYVLGYRVHEDTKSLQQPEAMLEESRSARRAYGQSFGPKYHLLRNLDRIPHNILKVYGLLGIFTLYRNSENLTLPGMLGPFLRTLRGQLNTIIS